MRAPRIAIEAPAAVLGLLAAVTVLLGWPRPSWACKGTLPKCGPCLYATCDIDHPAWYCEFSAAGASCNDGNACTSGDRCDGYGDCLGTPSDNCSINNGSGSCVPSSGACTYSCNDGYQLSGSTFARSGAKSPRFRPVTAAKISTRRGA
jgi:hypothetical protein